MKELEKKFDEIVEQLKAGISKQEILLSMPKEDADMAPLLELAESLLQVPKNVVPTPEKKRKFAMAPVKHVWLHWLNITRFTSVSAAAFLLLTASIGTSYAAIKSLPGEPLFLLKKYAENIQIKLANTPEEKASLRVSITEKRLADAQKVLGDPKSGPAQKSAVITELVAETNTTIAAVDSAAKSNALTQPNHPILASLENVTNQQQTLLDQSKPTTDSQTAVQATKDNVAKVAEIKRYVQATAEEQTLINLAAKAKTITISGELNAIDKNKLTVEKTVFNVDSKTTISTTDGKVLTISDLKPNIQVSITADKNADGTLEAKQVTVLTNGGQQTQPTASSTAAEIGKPSKPSGSPSSTSPSTQKSEAPQNAKKVEPTKTDSTPQQTDTAVGTFIPEDPAPQAFLK